MKAGRLKSKHYISAADIPDEGEIVTIDDVKIETLKSLVDGTSKEKGVLYFKEENIKPLALNSTNIDRITELLGTDETDEWIGSRIKMVRQMVDAFGKQAPAVRIEPAKSAKIKAPRGVKPM